MRLTGILHHIDLQMSFEQWKRETNTYYSDPGADLSCDLGWYISHLLHTLLQVKQIG